MSLDVYLTIKGANVQHPETIYIREDGRTRVISHEEWDEQHPDLEPVVMQPCEDDEVYTANITHNLNRMAKEAGIYKHLWRPDEIGITLAGELIEPLQSGLALVDLGTLLIAAAVGFGILLWQWIRRER
jgi:hypothetical protein